MNFLLKLWSVLNLDAIHLEISIKLYRKIHTQTHSAVPITTCKSAEAINYQMNMVSIKPSVFLSVICLFLFFIDREFSISRDLLWKVRVIGHDARQHFRNRRPPNPECILRHFSVSKFINNCFIQPEKNEPNLSIEIKVHNKVRCVAHRSSRSRKDRRIICKQKHRMVQSSVCLLSIWYV